MCCKPSCTATHVTCTTFSAAPLPGMDAREIRVHVGKPEVLSGLSRSQTLMSGVVDSTTPAEAPSSAFGSPSTPIVTEAKEHQKSHYS